MRGQRKILVFLVFFGVFGKFVVEWVLDVISFWNSIIIYFVVMQSGSTVDKNLKDFEALLEKCKHHTTQTRTTLKPYPSSTK